MRGSLTAIAAALALAVASPALAQPGSSGSYSGSHDSFAGNQGTIGSGAYGAAKNGGAAYSFGGSQVSGSSYSSTCGSCDAYTELNFKSKSVAGTKTYGKASGEAYGFNEADWRTKVSKEFDFGYSWTRYGNRH